MVTVVTKYLKAYVRKGFPEFVIPSWDLIKLSGWILIFSFNSSKLKPSSSFTFSVFSSRICTMNNEIRWESYEKLHPNTWIYHHVIMLSNSVQHHWNLSSAFFTKSTQISMNSKWPLSDNLMRNKRHIIQLTTDSIHVLEQTSCLCCMYSIWLSNINWQSLQCIA